jgi:hypothetical protein
VRQPAGYRTHFPAQLRGGFRAALAVQAAQDEGGPVFLRQAVHLVVQDRLEFPKGRFGDGLFPRATLRCPRFLAPAPDGSFGVHGSPVGNPVQPTPHRGRLPDRSRLTGEDQECDLEGVVNVLLVVQDVPADRPDQAPVAVYQRGKRLLVAARDVLLEELGVGQRPGHGDAGLAPQVAQDTIELSGWHRGRPPAKGLFPNSVWRPGARLRFQGRGTSAIDCGLM